MAISKETTKLITTALGQGASAEGNIVKACNRAVKLAYSREDFEEANYIIKTLSVGFRKHAVNYFEKCGLVIITNRGEMPTAKRVEDKSKQAKVFEKLANGTFGLSVVRDEDFLKAKEEKRQAKLAKQLEERNKLTVAERVKNALLKAFAVAQAEDDLDVQAVIQKLIQAQAKK